MLLMSSELSTLFSKIDFVTELDQTVAVVATFIMAAQFCGALCLMCLTLIRAEGTQDACTAKLPVTALGQNGITEADAEQEEEMVVHEMQLQLLQSSTQIDPDAVDPNPIQWAAPTPPPTPNRVDAAARAQDMANEQDFQKRMNQVKQQIRIARAKPSMDQTPAPTQPPFTKASVRQKENQRTIEYQKALREAKKVANTLHVRDGVSKPIHDLNTMKMDKDGTGLKVLPAPKPKHPFNQKSALYAMDGLQKISEHVVPLNTTLASLEIALAQIQHPILTPAARKHQQRLHGVEQQAQPDKSAEESEGLQQTAPEEPKVTTVIEKLIPAPENVKLSPAARRNRIKRQIAAERQQLQNAAKVHVLAVAQKND